MRRLYKNIPNIITILRMAGTIALIFAAPFSVLFFILYAVCGISDIADGFAARSLGLSSRLGAVLDSCADLLFYSVLLIRLVPELAQRISPVYWYIAGAIVLVRIASYTIAALKFKRFAAMHTYANKVTGAAVFLVPCLLVLTDINITAGIVCALAALSTAEELFIHILSRSYNPHIKSIFLLFRNKKT